MPELIDPALLRALIPIDSMGVDNFQELASKTYVENLPVDAVLFEKGDQDGKAVYLLSGEVDLLKDGQTTRTIEEGTGAARHPLAHSQPRPCTAKTKTECEITRIDAELLDTLITWDQISEITIPPRREAEAKGVHSADWMTRLLKSPILRKISPHNIQSLFVRVREIPMRKDSVVIKQGDEGDHYYIIKQGKCKVTRLTRTGAEIVLAKLSSGDSFGEEALLSQGARNANVIALTNGFLMKLSRADFNALLKEPLLNWVTAEEAKKLVQDEGAVWVDVRLKNEYGNNAIESSINIPLFMLRLKCATLDPEKKYILYCDTGQRSSAGVFLLKSQGFKAYCLKGGLVKFES